MKVLSITAGLLLFSIAPITNNEVELFTYWKKGDTQKLVIEEGFINYDGDEVTKKNVSITNVEMTVLEETDTSYTIEWNYTDMVEELLNVEIEEEEEGDAIDEVDAKIEELFDSFKLRFQTDEFGEITSVLNLDEIIQEMKDGIDKLLAEEIPEEDEEEAIFMAEFMKGMMDSELMRAEMVREIYIYHYYLGSIMVADSVIHYEETIENKISDDEIPAKGTVTISTDPETMTITINDLKQIDNAESKKAIIDAVDKTDMKKKKKLKNKLQKTPFTIEDVENYTYDYQYGRLKYFEQNRITRSENKRKENFLIIREIN